MVGSDAPGAGRGPRPELPGFDPLDYEQVVDPTNATARARRRAPAIYMAAYDAWMVTRHEDCVRVLRDPQTFSSRDVITLPAVPSELRDRFPKGFALETGVAALDPPEHSRLRKVIQPPFTARRSGEWEGRIRALADAIVDELVDEHGGSRTADLVPAFCHKLPVGVIAMMLGAPLADAPKLHAWTLDLVSLFGNPLLGHDEMLRIAVGQVEFEEYSAALVEQRRRAPVEGDFVTSLIAAVSDGGEPVLSDQEILGIVVGTIFAASDTAATAIGHVVHSLLAERALWERVRDDRALTEAAVEETLRLRDPSRAARRTATRDCEIGGVPIPEGSAVYVHLWSAGHDEAVFDDPESFVIGRGNVREHLTFGLGPHVCPGAPLARLEMRVSLECLLDRLPSLRLVEGHELRYARSRAIPSLLSGLVVAWD
jgi:cytochrome P450